ncbi:HAMP domain-containing sensor histidine kinase [Microbacterium horticulturae]|uniref:histidine kinase n=1 Tax=Microbacterium horticulturae TaxID=3028316 RepID=A0ABY8BUT2_9MICO|nr:HAMP domain-containing sensor histidine kinase [Microbacterium sp. KACC 23027]WEG07587.1 HAMP domain-containing sensor histidine kinase [Microbacterium sp. KACC 23027]
MHRSRRPISARTRILGAIVAVACVGLAIVGSVTFIVQRHRVIDGVDLRLTSQVEALRTVASENVPATPAPTPDPSATTATEVLDVGDYTSVADYLHDVVARLVPAQNEASVALIDGRARYQPRTLSGFDISGDTVLIDRALAETAKSKGKAVRGTVVTPQGSLRYIAIPVTMVGDPATGVYIRAVDLGAELAPVTASIITYGIAAIAVLVAIGGVGWFVAGRLLSPIQHLRDTADAITISDLGTRIPTQGNDDISDMTRTVNSMLDRLEGSVDVQRQLLDDVRHELKTPITVVRGHLELMDATDPSDVDNTRALGIAELDRMTRLVEDIDMLASVEGGESLAVHEVDVAQLTRRFGELIEVIPGHTWQLDAIADARVYGDPDRLLQAWLQLADNASKYTPAGAPVEVGSTASASEVRLWVRDHGPGIPPAARHRIFRRFDRGGGRRTVGGSGLGLAIVDAIMKAHAGACDIADTPGGGATFVLRIPVRTPEPQLPQPVRAGDVVLQREAAE